VEVKILETVIVDRVEYVAGEIVPADEIPLGFLQSMLRLRQAEYVEKQPETPKEISVSKPLELQTKNKNGGSK
jgi:hypothetical protein